jgi:hypothetical protein
MENNTASQPKGQSGRHHATKLWLAWLTTRESKSFKHYGTASGERTGASVSSPDRRGLTDALEDIRAKIGDTPPTREAFYEAVKTMNFQIENGGGDNEAFARSAKTVRRYLNKPL